MEKTYLESGIKAGTSGFARRSAASKKIRKALGRCCHHARCCVEK
jgi:hypothetical protein